MPSAGDNLSLGKLGRAVGTNGDYTSTMRLAADGRGSGAETKLSQFYISAVGAVTVPDSKPNESTSATTTLAFTNAGSLFLSRIGNRTQNFVWDETAAPGYFTLTENSDYTAAIDFGAVGSDTTVEWTVKYRDDGESADTGSQILPQISIRAGGWGEFEGTIIMEALDFLSITTQAADDINYVVYGMELT